MAKELSANDAIPSGWRTRKPGSTIWRVIAGFQAVLEAIWYSIYYIPDSLRPSREIGSAQSLSLEFGNLSDGQCVTIRPAPASTYRGPFTTTTTTTIPNKEAIKRETSGGSIFPLLLPSLDDGRPEDSEANASLLNITHAFWLRYRLTGGNSPTPIQAPCY
ncbi:uncharacterized protein BO95DRAFT_463315 [Aspergillus brunneoviolaceus CBS 621.78]|uniref:Uncharacterized protein n=1 Tax=Aspergillus brunneoviolaceus CBS 621.78 TaxID=1450534 RepID=A0ACD1GAX0_9EURO|nr:hypothetical protein BO95DRAFT_463315 [Aspergillus brunneoviolaceus CBS 621.78]RAH46261.1 hypothetical protein BO95DRAFT_463315 [Aspergillus brunneoviolaceus CBS 621.78]